MKYISILCLALCIGLTACNNNDETPLEVDIQITEQFLPAGVIFNKDDAEFKEKCLEWNNKVILVNSPEELPHDPLGFQEGYKNLSYSTHTLALYYMTSQYNIVSCRNRLYKQTNDDTINWGITLGVSGDIEGADNLLFSRFAIMIPKTTDSSNLKVWLGVTDHDCARD